MKYKGEKHQGPPHGSPYPLTRFAPAIELAELAREIAEAEDFLTEMAAAKLQLLAEQIEELQRQARKILNETKKNQELHRIQCGFRKISGNNYHLYRRQDGSLFFSLIGPQEWGDGKKRRPLSFLGTYRLERDQTWSELNSPQ